MNTNFEKPVSLIFAEEFWQWRSRRERRKRQFYVKFACH